MFPGTVTSARFVIGVPDLEVSAAFYREVLGFEVADMAPGWKTYRRGGCLIMAGAEPDALRPSQLGDHSYFAYMLVDDIDAYFEAVRAAGARIRKALRAEPWGMREFAVETVDGHRIMFAQPV